MAVPELGSAVAEHPGADEQWQHRAGIVPLQRSTAARVALPTDLGASVSPNHEPLCILRQALHHPARTTAQIEEYVCSLNLLPSSLYPAAFTYSSAAEPEELTHRPHGLRRSLETHVGWERLPMKSIVIKEPKLLAGSTCLYF